MRKAYAEGIAAAARVYRANKFMKMCATKKSEREREQEFNADFFHPGQSEMAAVTLHNSSLY